MRPLAELAPQVLRGIRGVFFDIDDTLTTEGRLTAEAYAGIERLDHAGVLAVPVTGRPAGWCDHIARMWPVNAVVGENGAFYFRYERAARRMQRRYIDPDATRARHRERLEAIAAEVVKAVPGAAIAADQRYRETDLAIDFCEDVPRLPAADVQRIVALMENHGLTVKVSSIHVNGWFGHYDKLAMTRVFLRECHDTDLDTARTDYVFVGDSPNDAPMFEFFPLAVGVANVKDFGDLLTHAPAYVTRARCGAGFSELADCILTNFLTSPAS